MNADAPQHLYRWFDKDDVLLYIGISVNAYQRAKGHQKSKWWPEAVKMTLEIHPNRRSVEDAEKEAIHAEKPKYNIKHQAKAPRPRPKDWWIGYSNRSSLTPWEVSEARFHEAVFGACFTLASKSEYFQGLLILAWEALDTKNMSHELRLAMADVAVTALCEEANRRAAWEFASEHGFVSGEYPSLTTFDHVKQASRKGFEGSELFEEARALLYRGMSLI